MVGGRGHNERSALFYSADVGDVMELYQLILTDGRFCDLEFKVHRVGPWRGEYSWILNVTVLPEVAATVRELVVMVDAWIAEKQPRRIYP